jgi:hypothetical protein
VNITNRTAKIEKREEKGKQKVRHKARRKGRTSYKNVAFKLG